MFLKEGQRLKIAVIGCGVIGSVLAKHFASNHSILLFDRNRDRAEKLAAETGGTATDDFSEADLVMLAIKPQDFAALSLSFSSNQLVVSVLAGVSLKDLKQHLSPARVLRIMPNIAMAYGEGVIGFVEDPTVTSEEREQIFSFFSGLGLLLWVSETKIDALTAISGSGPAFILQMIESLTESGVEQGFSEKEAEKLVTHTIRGALALLEKSGQGPSALMKQITAPGGTTEVGLAMMKEREIGEGLKATIDATVEKSRQLG